MSWRFAWLVAAVGVITAPSLGVGQQVKIGADAAKPLNARSRYSRYVNWRPASGEVVRLNPPRLSWPYSPDWPSSWGDALHTFTLQISPKADFSNPTVEVTCPFNFYNTLPALTGARHWYWRVGYDVGGENERWSQVRAFAIAEDAVLWDRAALAEPNLAERRHPRILFSRENLEEIRGLARTNPDSKAALDWMRRQADEVIAKSWWDDFPQTDRQPEPREPFYAIAHDLALVCFVWRMTGDHKYAGVKQRAVTWAGYPPGGRASPEGLGGDGSEDATQGNEFLALLFDWLYADLTEQERRTMIHSLTWRVDHIMNRFAWKSRRDGDVAGAPVRAHSLSGMCSSHQFEASMDTAVCGLALYEHSQVGREWFQFILNYLIGVTCGHGFDEAWNEGAGYGASKCKWLMNATMYFDTTLPDAKLGRNPFYGRIGDWFSRVIPVGMEHHAWGNQRNASRGNHEAQFRKLAYLTGQGRFLLNWREYGGRQFSKFRPWIEYVLPAYYEAPKPEPESDFVGVFDIDGWVTAATGPPSLRSTYQQGVGVIFQCRPRGGFSHSFNSDNSFQLHAYGQMLNHGGGSSANQDAYAYHTMSHNTILVDGLGQAQPSRGQLYPAYGRIAAFARGEDYVYFAGDATRCYPSQPGDFRRWGLPLDKVYEQRALPYLQRFVRHVLFLRGKYFVIFDDLASSQPAVYTWLYHIRPERPIDFDSAEFAVQYIVGDVKVRLQHVARPDQLKLDDCKGLDGLTNPLTGEDYRPWRKDDILCGHNLWISNATPAAQWSFLAVVYPAPPDGNIPPIQRIDDSTVRVGGDVISFNPKTDAAKDADFVVDATSIRLESDAGAALRQTSSN